jgi:sugar phosphate isomerase/epimerase
MTSISRRLFTSALLGGGFAAMAKGGFPPCFVGASADLRHKDYFQTMDYLRSAGFRTVEVQENGQISAEFARTGKQSGFCLNSKADAGRIRRAVDGFDRVTVHLPWTRLNYGGLAGASTDEGVLAIDEGLRVGGALGAKVAVLHFRPGEGLSVQQAWPVLVQRIRRWGGMARDMGCRLAVETGTPAAVKDFVRLIHEIDHPNVGATLDVGHQRGDPELARRVRREDRAKPESIRAYNDTNIWLVEQLREKLYHLHVHDIVPETWDEHQPLIYGFIDYPRLLAKLREVRYDGVLVLEIGPMEGMEKWLPEAKAKLEAWAGVGAAA